MVPGHRRRLITLLTSCHLLQSYAGHRLAFPLAAIAAGYTGQTTIQLEALYEQNLHLRI